MTAVAPTPFFRAVAMPLQGGGRGRVKAEELVLIDGPSFLFSCVRACVFDRVREPIEVVCVCEQQKAAMVCVVCVQRSTGAARARTKKSPLAAPYANPLFLARAQNKKKKT